MAASLSVNKAVAGAGDCLTRHNGHTVEGPWSGLRFNGEVCAAIASDGEDLAKSVEGERIGGH